jgi:hypothetical protein
VQICIVTGGGDIGMPSIDIWEVISQRTPGGSWAKAGATQIIGNEDAASKRRDHDLNMTPPIVWTFTESRAGAFERKMPRQLHPLTRRFSKTP